MELNYHPLEALRRVSERLITVADLNVSGLWGPGPNDRVSDVVAKMSANDFDVAPIVENPVRRYIARDDLLQISVDGHVEDAARPISASDLVTAGLPLADVLKLLDERSWFFIIDGHEIAGILTIADLQLLTVSLVVLGFVLASEAGIDALIRHRILRDWTTLLSDERLKRIEAVFAERRSRNAEIDLVACLNLEDRVRILAKSPELRVVVGMSRTKVEKSGEVLKRLRDTLAMVEASLTFRTTHEPVFARPKTPATSLMTCGQLLPARTIGRVSSFGI